MVVLRVKQLTSAQFLDLAHVSPQRIVDPSDDLMSTQVLTCHTCGINIDGHFSSYFSCLDIFMDFILLYDLKEKKRGYKYKG